MYSFIKNSLNPLDSDMMLNAKKIGMHKTGLALKQLTVPTIFKINNYNMMRFYNQRSGATKTITNIFLNLKVYNVGLREVEREEGISGINHYR